MKVLGQLEEASLENRAADPAAPQEGRLWLNKTTNKFKAYINGAVVNVLTAADLITTALIGDGQVTTPKIADSNVTTVKIADSNVTTAKIGNSQITTAKIKDGAVINAKLASVNFAIVDVLATSVNSPNPVAPTPNLNLTCIGRPVELSFTHFDAASAPAGLTVLSTTNSANGFIEFYRNSTLLCAFPLSAGVQAGGVMNNLSIPVTSIKAVDLSPPVGNNTYTFKIVYSGSTTTSIGKCKFYAREW